METIEFVLKGDAVLIFRSRLNSSQKYNVLAFAE